MNALNLLKQQHVEAHAMFGKIEAAKPSERAGLWAELHSQLELHEQIEERFLYDPVARDAGSTDPILARWEREHEDQVEEAGEVMRKIDGLVPGGTPWIKTVKALGVTLDKHIAHEENDIWPRIRAAWDAPKLEASGPKMAAAKEAVSSGTPIREAIESAS